MKYDLILFDLDNTLLNYKQAEIEAIEEMRQWLNIDVNPALYHETYKRINNQLWTDFENGLVDLKTLKSKRFRDMAKHFVYKCDAEECGNKYQEFLSKKAFPVDGMYEILDKLHDKATLAIVSNGLAKVQYNRINLAKLDKYFPHVFLSEEIDAMKPERTYFEKVFDALDWKEHHKAIIIGDNLNSDIKGGKNFGIKTCWVNLFDKENKSDIVPDYVVNSLYELDDILL